MHPVTKKTKRQYKKKDEATKKLHQERNELKAENREAFFDEVDSGKISRFIKEESFKVYLGTIQSSSFVSFLIFRIDSREG
jgi:hypothetical protein